MAANWPLRSQASLAEQFVGKSLHEILLPAAVVDISKVKRNCARMLEAIDELGVDFLAEVSSHRVGIVIFSGFHEWGR
jgi:D-serine deaminase-like pyridoxal phosphate-dependent protein